MVLFGSWDSPRGATRALYRLYLHIQSSTAPIIEKRILEVRTFWKIINFGYRYRNDSIAILQQKVSISSSLINATYNKLSIILFPKNSLNQNFQRFGGPPALCARGGAAAERVTDNPVPRWRCGNSLDRYAVPPYTAALRYSLVYCSAVNRAPRPFGAWSWREVVWTVLVIKY